MNKAFGLNLSRYVSIKSITMCMVLTIGSLLSNADYCRGQATDQTVEYETPGRLDAYEILPPELLEGRNYWVDRRVVSYGLNNRYTIYSHFGKFKANGEDMLRIRIQEIRAIEGLKRDKKIKGIW